jgi:hypothetical protein
LIVHCQAAGFIVCNHQHATEKFPIADALPEVLTGDNGDGVNAVVLGHLYPKKTQRKHLGINWIGGNRFGRWG